MKLASRPERYTSYEADSALLNTPAKRLGVVVIVAVALLVPFVAEDDRVAILSDAFVFAIAAIGLNLVTGYAGQVSLGHAFFFGLGAFTAAVLGGEPGGRTIGYGLDMVIWLPAAGLVAAAAGLLVSPAAVRLRGLYLAIVTLGLVFLGEHLFREAKPITGGVGVGRPAATPKLLGYRFDQPGLFGLDLSGTQKTYLLMLVFLILAAILGRNVARSAVGRAFAAVRDRDIAAAVIGVNLARQKALAFTVSSFFAGLAGALLYVRTPFIEPSAFNLGLSVQFIAMILIGGAATISGSIMGALFITSLSRFTQDLTTGLPALGKALTLGGFFSIEAVQTVLYGVLIVVFLIFEPRGLYGLWLRFRNYFKSWPFSY